MAISTIGTDALASAAVTSAKLASGAPSTSQLPAGTVLQVVYANLTTQISTSSTTYVDVVSASITPSSANSKVLVLTHIIVGKDTNNAYADVKIQKNSSDLYIYSKASAYTSNSTPNYVGSVNGAYLDSPATTSSTTYKVQARNGFASGGNVIINYDNSFSSIILMEVAA